MGSLAVRDTFWSHVAYHPGPGCWPWIGRRSHGYGDFQVSRKHVRAHRLMYELTREPIPEGLHVLHTCDNPACVNPAHLKLGTHTENMLDCAGKGRNVQSKKTACPKGHAYSGANLYVRRNGSRGCRACRSAVNRALKAKIRAALHGPAGEAGK